MQRTPNTEEIRNLLIQCRAERGISMAEASKAMHLSQSGLSKIERGMAKPQRSTYVRLVEFLRKHGYFPKTEAA